MKIIRNLALAATAGAMTLGVAGTTAASAGISPGITTAAPAMTAQHSARTYVEMHSRRYPGQSSYYTPSKFWLKGGGSAQIYTARTDWSSWGKNSAVGHGYMWGIRNGHKVYVGHVTMVFWERRSDAYFEGTGKNR